MPSATRKRPSFLSTRKLSSLWSRTRPTSVAAKKRTTSVIYAAPCGIVRRGYGVEPADGNLTYYASWSTLPLLVTATRRLPVRARGRMFSSGSRTSRSPVIVFIALVLAERPALDLERHVHLGAVRLR